MLSKKVDIQQCSFTLKLSQRNQGMTLVEVLVAVLIFAVAFSGMYSAILWGRYRATQTQYVVSAADVGRHQIEVIKSLGFTHAIDTVNYIKYAVSSTFSNATLNYGGIFSRTNAFSIDTNYDMESYYTDDSTISTNILREFTVNVYLHPTFGASTSDSPFKQIQATYVTYIVTGGI